MNFCGELHFTYISSIEYIGFPVLALLGTSHLTQLRCDAQYERY